ncbi:hypothetical protein PG991_014627 [Apiospora marii]|uniref:Uncharacterized protein n=1 Tax=Apiospora marii TaxID=335849 RepID=A0ABR1R492_9PEZI
MQMLCKLVDLWDWRYLYSYLHLLRPSELPLVPVVNHFDTWPTTRKLYDRVAIDIPARLPGLQEAEWELNDWEIRFIGLRRAHRHDLAQAVAETLPRSSNRGSLILVMKGTASFWVPDFSVGNLNMGDCQDFDVLSDAIRAATSGISALRYLRVCGVVDGSSLLARCRLCRERALLAELGTPERQFRREAALGGRLLSGPRPSRTEHPFRGGDTTRI